ncbi:MAG: hypothetical protein V4474_03715, partial [Patescibacteria group bacterium]
DVLGTASSSDLFVTGGATTTSFAVSNVNSGSLLKTATGGSVVAALANADYTNPAGLASAVAAAYPFPNNATTTQLSFNGGASTTLLSVFTKSYFGATATTTINDVGDVVVGGMFTGAGLSGACNGSTQKLLWASGTFSCGIDQTTGGGGAGSDGNWTYFNGSGIQLATTSNQVLIGAGATTTLAALEVHGGAIFDNATTTNLKVSGTATIGLLSGLLKASNGVVSTAVLGTDYQNFAYLFPSNATNTLIAFNGGLSSAST